MLAKKLLSSDSEIPTRPFNARPLPRFDAAPVVSAPLSLVRAPGPTLRSLAWARRELARSYDSAKLEAMLRFERLNLG